MTATPRRGELTSLRVEIEVRPGSLRTAVGGSRDQALLVRVVEPAHGGAATAAALVSLAKALGVPRSSVGLVRGRTVRRKLVEITIDADAAPSVAGRLAQLLAG